MNLSIYASLGDALVLLMSPLVEIVIHDLRPGTILYINGGLSKRKVGDPSLLEKNEPEEGLDKIVYSKLNFDGRLIKSISVPLSDKWLMCINCDISIFNEMQRLSGMILHTTLTHKPASLFKNDWQEKLHIVIHQFTNEKRWNFNTLSSAEKKSLVKHLYELDAFQETNAVDYVANILNMGRATIFNYLKKWRANDNSAI